MLREFFIESFKEGFEGVLIGSLIWILSGIITFFIFGLCLHLVDFNTGTESGRGVIINKTYTEGYTQILYTPSLGQNTVSHVPETFGIEVEIGDRKGDLYVNSVLYNRLEVGSEVICKFKIGRLTGNILIESVKINQK